MKKILSLLSILPLFLIAQSLPPGAGHLNVKDFGAKGDGITDDTAAIRKAVASVFEKGRYATPTFIYFPEGTYVVSGPIESKAEEFGWSGGWRAGMILWGESQDKTIIKLSDRNPAYGDPSNSNYVIATGSESDKRTKPGDKPLSGGGNRAFRHGIYHLTVDVGTGNPGAVGIDYVCSNRGSIEYVTIRSSDPQQAGAVGLQMTRNWPGPALIKNVAIEGFDYGITTSHAQYSMTFENIQLKGQHKAGVKDFYAQALFFRKLHSINQVPVFVLPNERNSLVLIDSVLEGGAPNAVAIEGKAIKYLRNVKIQGYGSTLSGVPNAPAANTLIQEYAYPAAIQNGSATMQPLPIEESPIFWSTDPEDFALVTDFGAAPGGEGDDAPGIQAAIDSGKPIVILPNGSYRISTPIILRGNVRLFMGTQSSIGPLDGDKSKVTIEVGAGTQSVNVEHLWIDGRVVHNSSRAAAFRHVDMNQGYENTAQGTGDVFFEDTIGKPIRILHPQRAFGRQVNCEFGDNPLIENHGGNLWLFGYKTEGQMPVLKNIGGKVELLGGFFYPLRAVNPNTPMIINEGGQMRLNYAMNGGKHNYPIQLQSASGKTLSPKEIGGRGPALLIDIP